MSYLKPQNWQELGVYHRPSLDGSAGGITFITSDLYFKIKGMPEYFKGTWGNEDNAFAYKMMRLGYPFHKYPFEAIHLYHSHKTIKDDKIKSKISEIKRWNRMKWLSEIKQNEWGVI